MVGITAVVLSTAVGTTCLWSCLHRPQEKVCQPKAQRDQGVQTEDPFCPPPFHDVATDGPIAGAAAAAAADDDEDGLDSVRAEESVSAIRVVATLV